MGNPELTKPMMTSYILYLIVGVMLMWFVTFSINLAFWIGICIIVFGHLINSLAYSAMREHPEKKKKVVDWGIYKYSRHPHILHHMITPFGAVIMGWNMESTVYIILWIYLIVLIIANHFGILYEEKRNLEKFGKEYKDYMKRTPRYFSLQK